MTEEEFDAMCDCEGWIVCDKAKNLARRMGLLKKAREWAEKDEK